MRKGHNIGRRRTRHIAIAMFLSVWSPLTISWLLWDGFNTFFSRPEDMEVLIKYGPLVFLLLCVWDIFVERKEDKGSDKK